MVSRSTRFAGRLPGERLVLAHLCLAGGLPQPEELPESRQREAGRIQVAADCSSATLLTHWDVFTCDGSVPDASGAVMVSHASSDRSSQAASSRGSCGRVGEDATSFVPSWAAVPGSRTKNRAPQPGALSTQIFPPNSSTRRRAR